MSESKHTPGPWRVIRGEENCVFGRDGFPVCGTDASPCDIMRNGDESEANALLIAASPELLNAASECLADMEHYVATHGPGPDKRLAALKAAIAKAEGQS